MGGSSINRDGIRFLFLDRASQMWKLISQYITAVESEMGSIIFIIFVESSFQKSIWESFSVSYWN